MRWCLAASDGSRRDNPTPPPTPRITTGCQPSQAAQRIVAPLVLVFPLFLFLLLLLFLQLALRTPSTSGLCTLLCTLNACGTRSHTVAGTGLVLGRIPPLPIVRSVGSSDESSTRTRSHVTSILLQDTWRRASFRLLRNVSRSSSADSAGHSGTGPGGSD